ncbi:hypothetical protein TUM20985_27690 [Mycobacterium antarcticum]|uniref:hypothetical protein n=1 Tax=unclassified Mycolicibacterium TaxID=2636767 RepID=UPI00239F1672|nr:MULTISPECIES: hypothetical protein [unclassified Mycolicibacterium]BDX32222.1 hypothetical protein TUM20985_27690 [Mycolicibacterium sp. TUM20985]GLP84221.1 hypothetical protein TUM20984_56410 [Mycolicibacterium sp. TUM20984]
MAVWDWLIPKSSQPGAQGDYRVVDVPGSRTRTVAGTSSFEETVDALPLGPVEVTLRLQTNGSNPRALAAYVLDQQVGWLATQQSVIESRLATGFLFRDPWVAWMTKLDAAAVQPRFQGLLRIAGDPGRRVINIDVPGPNEPRLSTIANQVINAKADGG